jgi:hypothetical protein
MSGRSFLDPRPDAAPVRCTYHTSSSPSHVYRAHVIRETAYRARVTTPWWLPRDSDGVGEQAVDLIRAAQ